MNRKHGSAAYRRWQAVVERGAVSLVDHHALVVALLAILHLGTEALALRLGIVQLSERIAKLLAQDEELEPVVVRQEQDEEEEYIKNEGRCVSGLINSVNALQSSLPKMKSSNMLL